MLKRFVDGVEVLVALFAVVAIVMLFTVEPASPGDQPLGVSASAEVYQSSCAACHSTDGSGGRGPRLVGDGALSRFTSLEELTQFVSVGRPGKMPGFETRLTTDELLAVSSYVFNDLGKP